MMKIHLQVEHLATQLIQRLSDGLWMQTLCVDDMVKVVEESDNQHPWIVLVKEVPQSRKVGFKISRKYDDTGGQ